VKQKGRGRPGKLVNLKSDLAEKKDLSEGNPDVMAKMVTLVAQAVATLGNDAQPGSEQREAHTLGSSGPLVMEK
jgi:hypothetical protein